MAKISTYANAVPARTDKLLGTDATDNSTKNFLICDINHVYNVKSYGALGDGTTDDSTAVIAAIQAAYDAGGGVVLFPVGTYKVLSQIVLPNDGESPPTQPSITLKGEGSRWDGLGGVTAITEGTSNLDLRYDGDYAKIVTLGRGILTIEGLNIMDSGTSSLPFLLTTSTILFLRDNSWSGNAAKYHETCDQDAIVLGGSSTTQGGDTASSAFGGYGTVIERNYFDRIRRGIYGRAHCNSVVIRDNMWQGTCGSDNTAGALEFDGTGAVALSNYMSGNLIEMLGYVYGYVFRNSGSNKVFGDSFWDAGDNTLASIRLVSADSVDNEFLGCRFVSPQIIDDTGSDAYIATVGRRVISPMEFQKRLVYRPGTEVGEGTDIFFGMYRSVSDPVNPNEKIFSITKGGALYIAGTESTPNGSITVKNYGSYQTSYGVEGVVSTRNLNLYANTVNDYVRIARGFFALPVYTSDARPNVNGRAGSIIYDSDLAKCILHNGTAWVNMDGTALA